MAILVSCKVMSKSVVSKERRGSWWSRWMVRRLAKRLIKRFHLFMRPDGVTVGRLPNGEAVAVRGLDEFKGACCHAVHDVLERMRPAKLGHIACSWDRKHEPSPYVEAFIEGHLDTDHGGWGYRWVILIARAVVLAAMWEILKPWEEAEHA